jgi:hypothetical protein
MFLCVLVPHLLTQAAAVLGPAAYDQLQANLSRV